MRANDLLAQVDMAKKKAEEAVSEGQGTIAEARETLNLLSGTKFKLCFVSGNT